MTPPTLPQELIDEIIDQFGETDMSNENRFFNRRVLATLSMVARAWKERSQKHLFSTIDFRKLSSINLTESDLSELAPVLSLTKDLIIDGCWEALSQDDSAPAAFLRRFRNLESLSLANLYLTGFSPEQLSACFGHFGETVTHLELEGEASSDSLIHLASMFPRLDVLYISITRVRTEGGRCISREVLPTTGSFQGYLYLYTLSEEHNNFLSFLSSASPKFDTIRVADSNTGDGVGKLLNSSATSLELLELFVDEDEPLVGLTSLSEYTQLREVSVTYPYPGPTAPLLCTIRSPHLKKFVVYFLFQSFSELVGGEDTEMLRKADDELRAAYNEWVKHAAGTIEVTFCIAETDGESGYSLEECQRALERLLPLCTENIAVTIECIK